MRPSSSSDPNAPHRATTPVFIDFFAKEAAEQQEKSATIHPQGPFAELSPKHRPDTIVDAGPSANSPVTVSSLWSFLRSKGHPDGQLKFDEAVQIRLNTVNLSAETLLAALEIIHTPDHALLITFGVSENERLNVLNKLKGIVNYSSGFHSKIIDAAQRSHNNPNELISNFLKLVRKQKLNDI